MPHRGLRRRRWRALLQWRRRRPLRSRSASLPRRWLPPTRHRPCWARCARAVRAPACCATARWWPCGPGGLLLQGDAVESGDAGPFKLGLQRTGTSGGDDRTVSATLGAPSRLLMQTQPAGDESLLSVRLVAGTVVVGESVDSLGITIDTPAGRVVAKGQGVGVSVKPSNQDTTVLPIGISAAGPQRQQRRGQRPDRWQHRHHLASRRGNRPQPGIPPAAQVTSITSLAGAGAGVGGSAGNLDVASSSSALSGAASVLGSAGSPAGLAGLAGFAGAGRAGAGGAAARAPAGAHGVGPRAGGGRARAWPRCLRRGHHLHRQHHRRHARRHAAAHHSDDHRQQRCRWRVDLHHGQPARCLRRGHRLYRQPDRHHPRAHRRHRAQCALPVGRQCGQARRADHGDRALGRGTGHRGQPQPGLFLSPTCWPPRRRSPGPWTRNCAT